MYDLLPISESSDWAVKVNMDGKLVVRSPSYEWALEQTHQPVKMMLKYIIEEPCVNAVRIFIVGNTASEAFPYLLKGTHFEDDGVLNKSVAHTCKVKQAGCTLNEQAAWINESAKALLLVVNEVNPIRRS
jgi:hypothetical protein